MSKIRLSDHIKHASVHYQYNKQQQLSKKPISSLQSLQVARAISARADIMESVIRQQITVVRKLVTRENLVS